MDRTMELEKKPIGFNKKNLDNNQLLVKNKMVKELIKRMEQINWYSSKNTYWEIGMKSAWRELKNIIDL